MTPAAARTAGTARATTRNITRNTGGYRALNRAGSNGLVNNRGIRGSMGAGAGNYRADSRGNVNMQNTNRFNRYNAINNNGGRNTGIGYRNSAKTNNRINNSVFGRNNNSSDWAVRRSTTSATRPGAFRTPMFNNAGNRGINANNNTNRITRSPAGYRATARAAGYRNTTAADARNSTITFIVLLSAIVALLALAIYALMRRPRHYESRITDHDSANRRR